ncbi:MAG: TRAP transporter TatT component family protein [Bryobacteraceae bacterium]|jgi:predicted anti-sigma-YlaC factor YlaD
MGAQRIASVCLLLACLGGCSIRRMAVNKLGNALASGGSTWESDEDPDLVGDALPFSLKLIESLLAESPRHSGLLLAAASGFTEYSYAFVDERADETASESLERSNYLRARARRLYLRAHGYGLRGLEVRYPGFGGALERDPGAALARVRKADVPLLYWTAASHGLAISASKDQPEMIAQLPLVEAMIRRVLELDANWGEGAVQEFLISIEAARSGVPAAEQQQRMRRYFEEALRLSGGAHAGLFVSFAENSCVPAQNRAEFQSMIERALAIDPDRQPAHRLTNLVAQHRARWLLSRVDELFLEPASPAP